MGAREGRLKHGPRRRWPVGRVNVHRGAYKGTMTIRTSLKLSSLSSRTFARATDARSTDASVKTREAIFMPPKSQDLGGKWPETIARARTIGSGVISARPSNGYDPLFSCVKCCVGSTGATGPVGPPILPFHSFYLYIGQKCI